MDFFIFQSWLKVLCGCTAVRNQKEPVQRDCYFFCTWQEDDQGQDTCRLFSGKDKECSRRKTIFHTGGWVLCEVRMSFCCTCKNVSAPMSLWHLRGKSYKRIQTSRSLSDSKGRFVSRTWASAQTKRAAEENAALEIATRVRRAWAGVTDRRCCKARVSSCCCQPW